MALLTPFQTVGPFLSLGLRAGLEAAGDAARAIVIRGRVLDGEGLGIPDAVLECWHPALAAVQRALTADDGGYLLSTIKPGGAMSTGGQAPHLALRVLGRGILTQYTTRLYFDDEPSANDADPILRLVPAERRHTIVAAREGERAYRLDLRLQGVDETVFFELSGR